MKKKELILNEDNYNTDKDRYFSVIESLLFVSGEPMKIKDIASIIDCNEDYTKELLKEISSSYEEERRGIKLISINDGFQLVTKPQNSDYIQKILKSNVRQSLSQASIETLAIIAYKQPITRVDIDEIRGVKSDSAIMKLIEKNLIKESGRLEVPGRPILYSTTDEFLKQFNIQRLNELPNLESFGIESIIATEEVASDSEASNNENI